MIYLSFLNLLLAQYLKVWRSSFDDPRISGSSKSFHMCTSESDGSSGSLANFRTRTRSLVYPHPPLKRKCMWGQCLEDLSVNLQPESGECELAQWLMFISGTSNQSLEDVSLHCGLCSSPAYVASQQSKVVVSDTWLPMAHRVSVPRAGGVHEGRDLWRILVQSLSRGLPRLRA